MKVSRTWLQKYFDTELPSTKELADALTFHAFEIEEAEGDMLDVKVLPDRACYALSHRGVAKELSAILSLPLKSDPLRAPLPKWQMTDALSVAIDPSYVLRHTGALVRGVTVGPSPAWLADALASVGARSINNVVDALNFVMLDIGQPSGAFDAGKLTAKDGKVCIEVRPAKNGEKIRVLTGEEYELAPDIFVFADAPSGMLLDIAGIKGGLDSGVTGATTDIFLTVGNYEPTLLRKVSQKLKLFTDASSRYQNRVPPELTAYGMRDVLALIQEVAGGEVVSVVDERTGLPKEHLVPVHVSLDRINRVLGTELGAHEVASVLDRLDLSFVEESRSFAVTPPFERRDISIPEDLIEEVGRIIGYDTVAPRLLPALPSGTDQARYRGIERVKDLLVERGFTELSTPSFSSLGDILLANPLQKDKPYLRPSLAGNMSEALTRAVPAAPRVLGPTDGVRLFEIGNVFDTGGERLSLAAGYRAFAGGKRAVLAEIADALSELGITAAVEGDVLELSLGEADLEKLGSDYETKKITLQKFRLFSNYPFALRDVAVWSPSGTEASEVELCILKEAGDLLARIDMFDRFEKEGRVSHAFRLAFESMEKTLSDEDLAPVMERITAALGTKEGWEVR